MDGEITDPCDFEQLGMGQAYRFSDFPEGWWMRQAEIS